MKIFSIRTFKFFSVICIIALILFFSFLSKENVSAMLCGKATKKMPVYSVDRNDKCISISFDCAWGNEYTDKLLEIMKDYSVQCTFFTVSFWAEKYADDLKKIVKMGHEVGTHSKTHSHMNKLSKSEVEKELFDSVQTIENITGQKVELFRPPFGEYNNNLIECCENMGLYPIQWDTDSLDWKNITAKEIALRVIKKVKSGSIILCHNNGLHTAESLPLIFSTLQKEGYKFVKISDLIYKDNYIMANDGKQIKNK